MIRKAAVPGGDSRLPGVFISYRRELDAGWAPWVYDKLSDHFGGDRIFMDLNSIAAGDDFVEVITQGVASCRVLIALIGKGWSGALDAGGRRRLDDPADFVRLEIESALRHGIRVIPLLIEGATMPPPAELPATLAPIASRQALTLTGTHRRYDAEHLVEAVKRALDQPPAEPVPAPPPSPMPMLSAPAQGQLLASAARLRSAPARRQGRSRRYGRHIRGLLTSLIIATWGLGLLIVILLLAVQGAERAAKWASVVGAITALISLTAPFAIKAVGRLRAADDIRHDVAEVDQALDELAAALLIQWSDEARTRRLQDPWPLPVKWRAADPALVDHVGVVLGTPGFANMVGDPTTWLSGQISEAVDAYELLPNKRLVIIGAPGSGKSVFAMVLTLTLLERRSPGAPVPVLFAVASWDPSRSALQDWMIDYLDENVEFSGSERWSGRSIAESIVHGGRILPILDGLDEMPPEMRLLAIQHINRALQAAQPIILTCRSEEYRHAVDNGDVLTFAAVVELEPLDLQATISYLRQTTPTGRVRHWDPVFARMTVEPDGVLATVLRAPLMVSLARAIYGDNPGDPSELLHQRFEDRAVLEDHLLDRLIPATYWDSPSRSSVGGLHWRPGDVMSWLVYLARYVDTQSRPDLAWWQLELAVPRVIRRLPASVAVGVLMGLVFGPVAGLGSGLLVAVVSGISPHVLTVEAWLTGRFNSWTQPSTAQSGIRRAFGALAGLGEKVAIERRIALTLGRFTALIAGIAAGLTTKGEDDLFRVVAHGLGVALAVGLAVGLFTISPRVTPSEVQFEARRGVRVFLRHVGIGVLAGLGSGVAFGLLLGSAFGITVGVALGLSTGLIDGLSVWLDVPADVTRARSPMSTRRDDRRASIARSVVVGVTIGVTSGIAFGLAEGPGKGVLYGIAFGAAYAAADAYFGLISTVSGRYVIARTWLALAGRLPWHLMAFLDDAHEHGVLRRAGAVYQFRHTRLQERLAAVG